MLAAASRVFFQPPAGVGCAGSGPMPRDDPVQRKQGKVTVKYDRKELRKRLILEEWIIEQLSDLYDCEVRREGLFPDLAGGVIYFIDSSDCTLQCIIGDRWLLYILPFCCIIFL